MNNRPVSREKNIIKGEGGIKRGRSVFSGGTSMRGVKGNPENEKERTERNDHNDSGRKF